MSSVTDPDETKRVEVTPIKCPKCKLTLMALPDDKVCPLFEALLPKPVKHERKLYYVPQ